MENANYIKLRNIILMLTIYIFIGIQNVSAMPVDCVLENNQYIDLENNATKVARLNISQDGIYIIKTSGVCDVAVKVVDDKNEEVLSNFIERSNNYFASYYLKANENYYVKAKLDTEYEDAFSRLWLFCLDDAFDIKYLNDSLNHKIEMLGQDVYFKFIPQHTNTYIINSYGKLDLEAQVYDENGKRIAQSSEISGLNFKVIKELERDKCYYIRVYSQYDIGIFDIEIQKDTSKYADVIDMTVNDNVDDGFYGYIKKGQQQNCIKFIPNSDGEYKFVVISDMELELDILDIAKKSIAQHIENSKNYSFALLQAQKGKEYNITITEKTNETGMYKLVVLKFENLMKYAVPIIQGENEVTLQDKEEYFKFRCPEDGIFNFALFGGYDINLELYNENGKCIKIGEECAYINNPTVGGFARKNDTLYLKASRKYDILKEECEIYVNNFEASIKNCGQVWEGEIQGEITQENQEIYYQFIPKEDGIYFIKSKCRMYIDGNLYDDMGNLLSENTSEDMKLFIARKLRKNNTYYIHITDLYKNGSGKFSFEISLYNGEEDYPIIDGEIQLEDEIEYLGAVNHYEFKVCDTGIYTISLTSESNICFSIIDQDGKEIVSDNSQDVSLTMNKNTKYEMTVFGENELTDVGEYILNIENFSNKVRDAKTVFEAKKYNGNLIIKDTQDYYTFTPQDNNYYSIYTTGDVNTYIEVYNMKGELIKTVDNGFDSNFYLVMKLEKGEDYLLKVGARKPNNTGIYELNIKKGINQDNKKTQWLRINDVTTDILENDQTYRLYKFIAPKSGEYFVDNYSEVGIDIELSDKNEVVLKSETSKCSDNHKCYKLNENSLYYMRVKAKEGENGIYNIKIENMTKAYDNAISLSESKIKSGTILEKWQTNYYKFVPYETKEYLIAQMNGAEMCIEVFDQYGNMINITTIADIINRTVLEYGNKYYIRLRSKHPIPSGEYEFFVMAKEDLERYSEEFLKLA